MIRSQRRLEGGLPHDQLAGLLSGRQEVVDRQDRRERRAWRINSDSRRYRWSSQRVHCGSL